MSDKTISFGNTPNPRATVFSGLKDRDRSIVAGLLFFFSGAVGLVYQVAWIKAFALQMGASAWSISSVIAAFMTGLGVGSWWAGKNVKKWGRALRAYGYIELGIAVCGVISIPVLAHVDVLFGPVYRALTDHFAFFVLFQLSLVFVFLFIPTALMGASLPVLVVGMARRGNFEKTVGYLYGINTLGAAFGVVATGFFLLPRLGLRNTILTACAAGVVIGLLALLTDRFDSEPTSDAETSAANRRKAPMALLWLTFASGALSIFYEVCWSRLLAPVLGSSTYAFSVILTTFLIGIGLGGLISARKWTGLNHRAILAFLMVATGILVTIGLASLNFLPHLFLKLAVHVHENIPLFFVMQGLVAAALLFLPTLMMGIMLPMTVTCINAESGDEGKAIGGVYLFNTLGSILGSLMAGFVLIPLVGAPSAVLLATAIQVVVACAFILPGGQMSSGSKRALGFSVVFFAILAYGVHNIKLIRMTSGVYNGITKNAKNREIDGESMLPAFLKDGLNSTIAVYKYETNGFLVTDGEAQADITGGMIPQYGLANIPLFLHPNPDAVCIIGLGSGATARAAASHPISRVDVVELEPGMVAANKYFSASVDDLMNMPKVHVHIEDGKTFLKYTPRNYDVIISQPSHPWVAGTGSLFTTENYEIVKKKLAPGGIFCQWIQAYEVSTETLHTMFKTLSNTFPHVVVFEYESELICIASDRPLGGTLKQYVERMKVPDVKFLFNRMGVDDPYAIYAHYVATFPEDLSLFPAKQMNTDDNLYMEFRAPLEMYMSLDPALPVLPAATIVDRLKDAFFPDGDRERIILALADSVRQRRRMLRRIEDLYALTKNPETKAHIRQAEKIRIQVDGQEERLNSAAAMVERNEVDKALAALEKEALLTPRETRVHQLFAEAYLTKGDTDKAIARAQKAIECYPDNFNAIRNLAEAWAAKGDTLEAEKMFRLALEKNSFFLPTQAAMIAFLKSAGRTGEMEAFYSETIDRMGSGVKKMLDEMVAKHAARAPYVSLRKSRGKPAPRKPVS